MHIERLVLVSLLFAGCSSTGPNLRAGAPTSRSDPTWGADTGALASDTTSPSGAWLRAGQNEPAMQSAQNETDREVEDRGITRRMGRAVIEDDRLSDATRNIVISTQNGAVVLRGNVASEQDRNRIETDARSVRGVSRVQNQIRVVP